MPKKVAEALIFKWGECEDCGCRILKPEDDVDSPYLCIWCSYLTHGGNPNLFTSNKEVKNA